MLRETYPAEEKRPSVKPAVDAESIDLDREAALQAVTDETIEHLRSALGINPATGAPWIDASDYVVCVAVGEALKSLAEVGREDDPARFGDDSSVIWTRIGRDARSFAPVRLRGADTMTLAARVAEHVNTLRLSGRPVIINVDGGGVGGGVIDRLRSVGFDVNEVQFGGRAIDSRKWANRRAEIWGAMRDWLTGGAIPKDEILATDLTCVEYGYNAADAILLEKKESMKARGLASPDSADALAITFAVPVPVGVRDGMQRGNRRQQAEYDPYAALNRGHDPVSLSQRI